MKFLQLSTKSLSLTDLFTFYGTKAMESSNQTDLFFRQGPGSRLDDSATAAPATNILRPHSNDHESSDDQGSQEAQAKNAGQVNSGRTDFFGRRFRHLQGPPELGVAADAEADGPIRRAGLRRARAFEFGAKNLGPASTFGGMAESHLGGRSLVRLRHHSEVDLKPVKKA